MDELETLTYEVTGRIARITLNRPERGNGITLEMPRELAACVERANLDPDVHVIALAGNGSGFCGGYDLVGSAERNMEGIAQPDAPAGSPLDPEVQARNHDPDGTWDPVTDYQMMSRNLRGFMSLFHSDKPTITKVHGYCVAGGTDMALCSDLLVVEDRAKIGYPPARVWGVPTSALWAFRVGPARAKQLLLTGDSIDGTTAAEWGLATEAAPAAELDDRFEELLRRVSLVPINQLVMHKLLMNQALYAQGLEATQQLGVFFDGIARHTPEGFAWQRLAAEKGFKEAVRERDDPFGDFGLPH
jgi:enoyl-CoA hydratase/carnithine racemase